MSKPLEIWNERQKQNQIVFAKKSYTIPAPYKAEEADVIAQNANIPQEQIFPKEKSPSIIKDTSMQQAQSEKINDEPEDLNIPIEK